jgi:hypothetical protein
VTSVSSEFSLHTLDDHYRFGLPAKVMDARRSSVAKYSGHAGETDTYPTRRIPPARMTFIRPDQVY